MVRIGTDGSLSSLSPSLTSRRSLPPTILLRQLPSLSLSLSSSCCLSLSLALAIPLSRSPALITSGVFIPGGVSHHRRRHSITGGVSPSPAASLITGSSGKLLQNY